MDYAFLVGVDWISLSLLLLQAYLLLLIAQKAATLDAGHLLRAAQLARARRDLASGIERAERVELHALTQAQQDMLSRARAAPGLQRAVRHPRASPPRALCAGAEPPRR